MQSNDRKKEEKQVTKSHVLVERLESLTKKNERAYDAAIEDFRDRFSLGSVNYSEAE
ncbi:hypothetical protein [Martelella mediterranea]|uniref:hypothetical protein n=1 Tax=Martelella mediterranea TaxID=293089 RepID=UPI0012BABB9B|nr:hypothetical protein [Martelella mediterranea]